MKYGHQTETTIYDMTRPAQSMVEDNNNATHKPQTRKQNSYQKSLRQQNILQKWKLIT